MVHSDNVISDDQELADTFNNFFEHAVDNLVNSVDEFLSPYLCGYQKGFNTQYGLLPLIEKRKTNGKNKDNKRYAGAILVNLSKAFDTIYHKFLIEKLYAYAFSKDALKLINSYMSDHWQRAKLDKPFSSLSVF